MADRMVFDDREQFLEVLRQLLREGVPGERIRVITPFGVPEVEEILPGKRSKVRFLRSSAPPEAPSRGSPSPS